MPQNRASHPGNHGTAIPNSTIRLVGYSVSLGLVICQSVLAEPTDITIRVVARSAMYVGDLVEGAQVTLSDAESGEVLAQGVTEGDAGEPERIMDAPRKRGAPMAASGDAHFSATIDIDEPRYLQATAFGPLQRRETATKTTMTQWVVPGKHLTGGDGWVLELAGFMVRGDLESSFVSVDEASRGVTVEAEVAPMCGCPVKPGFYWDADSYEVTALVKRGEAEVGRYALGYAGSASDFAGSFSLELPGVYDITVYAYDPASGNTGVDRIELTVTE
jgi:hypothetical protein